MSHDLQGKTALIIGASRGIGRAAAYALAERGATVGLMARTVSACQEAADDLNSHGFSAFAAECDITDYSAVAKVVEDAEAQRGRVDILVNNAGVIEPIGSITETSPEAWADSININLLGAYNCIRAVLPGFLANGGGTVINVSSGAALRPVEGWSAYCSGKAGLAMLTKSIHLELADRGIRAFSFQPGVVDTDMQVRIRASGINEVSRLRRSDLLSPDVPAAAIAWLCTDEAAGLTGTELSINDAEFTRFRNP